MKNTSKLTTAFLSLISIALFTALAAAQETNLKQYANNGVTFSFPGDWEMTEQSQLDMQRISLSNKETDSQILVTIVNQKTDSKEPMVELKKKVIDPWVKQLIEGYAKAQLKFKQEEATAEIGSEKAEGMRLKFYLDERPGTAEAFWTLMDKRLVLLYFIRPDKTSDKANVGWDAIRKSIRIDPAAKTRGN